MVLNVGLWILQVLLAPAFAAHGWMMLFPSPEIAALMNANLPRWFSLFIGVAEVAAAIGLILPGLTRIMPFFVTWAAIGIAIIMVSATGYHASRGEYSSSATTFVLLLMAVFLVYGRARLRPIHARGAA
jgi:putative oxidoreductase